MQPRLLAHHVGNLLLIVAVAMLVPAAYGSLAGEGESSALFLLSGAITAVVGALLRVRTPEDALNIRTALGVVTLGWAGAGVASALPLWLSGLPWVDAFFEAVSGVTTTGATAVSNVETLDRSLLLWRSMLQWLGGMGIVVLSASVFPRLGIGAIQLFRAEVSGPQPEKLLPRLSETSKLLWRLYALLTAAAALLFWRAGMPIFDAVNHAMTTVSTGGFSTRSEGIATFQSPAVETVATVFMFLGATNFMLLYRVFRRGQWRALLDEEFRLYFAFVAGGGLLIAASLWLQHAEPLGTAVRRGLFQVASVISSTGFAAADFTSWPPLAQAVLFLVMFVGGSAGSTAGGPKVIRILIALKHGVGEIRRMLHPRSVRVVRLADAPVANEAFAAVTAFLSVYMVTWFGSIVVLSALGLSVSDAAAVAISTLGNIGVGFGAMAPTETLAGLSAGAKLYLSFLMLAGRLELLSVFLLLQPEFWARGPRRRVRA